MTIKRCNQVIFEYHKDSPYVLELHIGKHLAEELKEQIEKNSPLVIETQQGNKRYKYVIRKSHSCEIEVIESVLKITFDGKVYRNDDLVDTQLKCSSVEEDNCWIVREEQLCSSSHRDLDCDYTFYQQQKTEQEPVVQGNKEGKKVRFAEKENEPPSNTDCNTSIYCPLGLFTAGCLAMAGGAVLCFADRPDIGGILMASAIVCLLIVGIVKLCEKVSEKKQKDPDISTCADVKSVFSGIFCSEVLVENYKT